MMMMYIGRRKNRTWLIYITLMLLSFLVSSCGQESEATDSNNASFAELEISLSGEDYETVSANIDASNEPKSPSSLRHMDSVHKELALCSATLMAAETREKMLKHQLSDCQALPPAKSDDAVAESLEYQQRIQQLELSLKMEREQMQQKLSHSVLLMNQQNQEFLRTNQRLQQQNENVRKQLVRVQNELFDLRYEYHRFNEAQRQKQISLYGCYDFVCHHIWWPLLDWLRHPLWDRILQPHVVVPLTKLAKRSLSEARKSYDSYAPICKSHFVAARSFVLQEYMDPAYRSILHFMQTNSHVINLWKLIKELYEQGQTWLKELLEQGRTWFESSIAPILLPWVERLGEEFHWLYQTISDVLYIFLSSMDQWLGSRWNLRQGTGLNTCMYNLWLSLLQSMAVLADGKESWMLSMMALWLVYLIRHRRRRYLGH